MTPRGGHKDASVGPGIGEISSYIPWEGDMGGQKGEFCIVPVEGIVWWDFTGKGS